MPIADLTSKNAVLQAIGEFRELGQEEFLKKYESHPSTKYLLRYQGRNYDSKAIVRAAYGFQFPDRGFFRGNFGGGEQTIALLRDRLGFDIIEKSQTDTIRAIAETLNRLSKNYDIGHLQEVRRVINGRRSRTTKLFTKQTIHDDYAFHDGGRSEFQFNIGLEEEGHILRYGVAFSLQLSRFLPKIDPLIPKVQRFNEYLLKHEDAFKALKMWIWDQDGKGPVTPVHSIGPELIRPDIFIFIGKSVRAADAEPEDILTTFDELLPVYRYVESGGGNGLDIPQIGEELDNLGISAHFGVGLQGGMRRSLSRNLLVLISDPFKGLYEDRWERDVLHYTGMGPVGDQSLSYAQNKTLAESNSSNIGIHLLEAIEQGKYVYVGRVKLEGKPYQEDQPDSEGNVRKVWMFPLSPFPDAEIPELTQRDAQQIEASQAAVAKKLSLGQLKLLAGKAKSNPVKRSVTAPAYSRDQVIVELVKRLANGICDLCEEQAPFLNKQKEAYLECHHVMWLAKGGLDRMSNAVALCPNCHRKMHILDRTVDRKKLIERATKRCRTNGLPL